MFMFQIANITKYIFSFLDDKDLRSMAQTCKQGKVIADDPVLWKNLFERTFHMKLLKKMIPKEAFRIEKIAVPCKIEEIRKIYNTFICNLKWEQKRRLEIHCPSYVKLVVELGFGFNHGREESFDKCEPNEIKYYKLLRDEEIFNTTLELEPNKGVDPDPKMPIYSKIILKDNLRNVKERGYFYSLITSEQSELPFEWLYTGQTIVKDVGEGNTLGYISELNGWKEPFKLYHLGENRWWGRFPELDKFKFIKIDNEGNIFLEKIKTGRHFCHGARRHCSQDSLGKPIEF